MGELEQLKRKFPLIIEVRGIGLMIGMESGRSRRRDR